MASFFLLFEILHLVAILFLAIRYSKLSIMYLPVIYFIRYLYEPQVPALIWYTLIMILVFLCYSKNVKSIKRYISSHLFLLYVLILLVLNSSGEMSTSYFFNFVLLLLTIPLVCNIYIKYDKETIYDILNRVSVLILLAFVFNVLISSVTGYYGPEGVNMYGITSELSYGSMFASHFNVLPIAFLIIALRNIKSPSSIELLLLSISFLLILFSLRRSVIAVLLIVTFIVILWYSSNRLSSKVYVYMFIVVIMTTIISLTLNIPGRIIDMFDQRGVSQHGVVDIERESRYLEYFAVYNDLFISKNYSPYIGYELFNSSGNYGNGAFGDRSLHSDITTIVHATGLIGIVFYLYIFGKMFFISFMNSKRFIEKTSVLLMFVVFAIYSFTGRITDIPYILMIIMFVIIPYSKSRL